MALSPDLLEVLACPKCKGDVHVSAAGDAIVCDACKLAYPVREDIPVMIIEEAKPVG